ncbi:MAG: adenosylmethionine decarboxylase [Nitrospinae bacterium]|nr:adenosylmethionine decarboxylase [Nitrospinota bacterium]
MKQPLGRHHLVELFGCDGAVINAKSSVREILLEAVAQADGAIVADVFHDFSPHGVSGVVVIAESHVAVHTWPEFGIASLDIFSCGEKLKTDVIKEIVKDRFRAQSVTEKVVERGVG